MSQYPETESNNLEFKEKFPDIPRLLREVIAFCNTYGGRILIGVTDQRKVIGLPEADIELALETLPHTIHQAIFPHVIPKVYTQRFENSLLLVIQVSEGMSKPYFLKSKGLDAGTFVRVGRSSVKADSSVIRELEWRNKGRFPDEHPVYGSTIKDLDLSGLNHIFERKGIPHPKSELSTVARSYRVLCEDQGETLPTLAGIMLLGNHPEEYFPESYVVCTHFKGSEGRDVIRTIDARGTLFAQFASVYQFLLEVLSKSFIIRSVKREEKLEIPEVALREVLVNALVHRDYAIQAPIKIAIYQNRVEFFSPGSFPGPLQVSHLEDGITYVRNAYICKMFREFGYIEKMGTGFRELFRHYRLSNLQKPQVIEGENFVKVILPRKANNLSEEAVSETRWILDCLATHERAGMSLLMQHSPYSKATLGRMLRQLLTQKYIVKYGKGPNTEYGLS